MYAKIYGIVWMVVLLTAGVLFAAGLFTPIVTVAFGFLAFGLVFMGMMSVLPSTVGHHAPDQQVSMKQVPGFGAVVDTTSSAWRKIGAGLSAPSAARKANLH